MVRVMLGGESRPFQITPRVLSLWMSESKKGLNDLGNLSFEDLSTIFYHGFRSAEKAETKQVPTITKDQFDDWMDTPEAFATLRDCQAELEGALQAMMGEAADSEKEQPGN